jgi:hypothetical protein
MRIESRRLIVLGGVLIVVAALAAGAALWRSRAASGPGAVAIRYTEALDRHDLAAANTLLSAKSQPMDPNMPAERLGERCVDPVVAETTVTGTFATVRLSCANRSGGPGYPMVLEDGAWKIVGFGVR